jgi:pre-60S factor REI1
MATDRETGFYCSTSGTYFSDKESLAEHYKSDFHRYNLKRKVCPACMNCKAAAAAAAGSGHCGSSGSSSSRAPVHGLCMQHMHVDVAA